MASSAASPPLRTRRRNRLRVWTRQRCERRRGTFPFGVSRPSLGDSFSALATSGLVGETLSNDALQRLVRAHGIVNAQRRAGIIAEIELREVAVKMLLA